MPSTQSTRQSRQSVPGRPKRSRVSCFFTPEMAGMISNADIDDKPHLKRLAATIAEFISSPSKTARDSCTHAITVAQHKEGLENSLIVDICDTKEEIEKRLESGAHWSVITEQQPTACFTAAEDKTRSCWSLLSQPPEDENIGKHQLRRHMAAASHVKASKRFAELQAIQKSRFPKRSDTAVTESSEPFDHEQDPEDFAQTAPEDVMAYDGFSLISTSEDVS